MGHSRKDRIGIASETLNVPVEKGSGTPAPCQWDQELERGKIAIADRLAFGGSSFGRRNLLDRFRQIFNGTLERCRLRLS
jgi:hypothetical protein